jgi:pantoate--beta-alanine ligase
MGALHAGHMALIAEARKRAEYVAATIFVNPAQFGAGEDLAAYPRRAEQDQDMLAAAGCDLLWVPETSEIYPAGFATTVHVDGVAERWEGRARPGHFDGVATVVTKLLLAVRPDLALFGEKDFQQLAVIRRLVEDLSIAVQIVGIETVRESDSLALSSRNAYLSTKQRASAVALPSALTAARKAIETGSGVDESLEEARRSLRAAGFDPVDYIALVDVGTLEPVTQPAGDLRLIAAAKIGTTRLFYNLPVRIKSAQR